MAEALNLLRVMKQSGRKPSLENYNFVLELLGKEGNISECRELIREMENIGVAPNILSYNSVITALKVSGKTTEALKVAQSVTHPESATKANVETKYLLLEIHAMEKQLDIVKEQLIELKVSGLPLSLKLFNFLLAVFEGGGHEAEFHELTKGVAVLKTQD